jgi:ABC-type transport system involved in cytochrome bd biosynthesis fused ATPase/permease subunit
VAGQRTVSGDAFIQTNYRYYYSHVWRNFGILLAFLVVFMLIYFAATELNSKTASKAEVLVFQRGHVPAHLQAGVDRSATNEELGVPEKTGEGQDSTAVLEPQTDIFTWKDVVYDIEIKGEPRRLLDNVTGWVKPGTLTALMGVSGAGKTTLLDVLAQRTSMGVITGDMFVNGKPLDASFQRKTGYVQQQGKSLSTLSEIITNMTKIFISRPPPFARVSGSAPCSASLPLSAPRRSMLGLRESSICST